MENSLQIFSNPEFGEIRTVEIDGKPWFVAKDITKALGYANHSKAIADNVTETHKLNNCQLSSLGQRGGWLIDESGLYRLVMRSKLQSAEHFQDWVTDDVLPSIRKTGGYILNEEKMTDDELLASAFIVAQKKIEERNKRISQLESENKQLTAINEEQRPKAEYFDTLVDKSLLTNFTNTAKEFGVKPKSLITYLVDNKYLYRDSQNVLLPYENKNKGLFEVKETINRRNGFACTQTFITPKGRETFRRLISVAKEVPVS